MGSGPAGVTQAAETGVWINRKKCTTAGAILICFLWTWRIPTSCCTLVGTGTQRHPCFAVEILMNHEACTRKKVWLMPGSQSIGFEALALAGTVSTKRNGSESVKPQWSECDGPWKTGSTAHGPSSGCSVPRLYQLLGTPKREPATPDHKCPRFRWYGYDGVPDAGRCRTPANKKLETAPTRHFKLFQRLNYSAEGHGRDMGGSREDGG